MTKRAVFFLSDHTGITAEKLGHSLLSQFEELEFDRIRVPYIKNHEKALKARDQIDKISGAGQPALVISSILDPELRTIIQEANCVFFDFFEAFITPMEQALGKTASLRKGRVHGLTDQKVYHSRIEAVDYTLMNDDGAHVKNYDQADLILIGVSRSGKTPTCLYLALQYGINAANYPLAESELDSLQLPGAISLYKDKVFGLSIDPDRLQMIRQERLPKSRYATRTQCRHETSAVEELYHMHAIPFINTSTISIEEISTTIMDRMQLQRKKI